MLMYVHLIAASVTFAKSTSVQHIEWWRDLQKSFPGQSNWTSSGTSYEGRDIFGVHLWGANGPGKPAVLYHGTVHAREWITAPYVSSTYCDKGGQMLTHASTIEYVAQQLIKGYKSGDNITQAFLNSYDFFIFPFVNPDGTHALCCHFAHPYNSQALFTPKPTSASGERTVSHHQQMHPIRHASAAISTAIGRLTGTPTHKEPLQILVLRPTAV
jgi:murein tripeptide amidase MpaA